MWNDRYRHPIGRIAQGQDPYFPFRTGTYGSLPRPKQARWPVAF